MHLQATGLSLTYFKAQLVALLGLITRDVLQSPQHTDRYAARVHVRYARTLLLT